MPFSSGLRADTEGTHFLWPRLFAYTLPFEFLCGGGGANFLPSGQGIAAHSVAGVRWQSPVPGKKKDTKATLSALLLPLPAALLSVVPFCPSRCFEAAKKNPSFFVLFFLSGTAVRRHIGVFLIERKILFQSAVGPLFGTHFVDPAGGPRASLIFFSLSLQMSAR